MTDQDNLRARIEEVIEAKTYAMAPDGFIAGTEEAAQAIIDEFGLKREWRVVEGFAPSGFIDEWRFVGKWEKQ